MISSNISRKYFLIFIAFQIFIFVTILGFIGLVTWSEIRTHNLLHYKNNFNLTIDESYELIYLDLPQRKEISCFVMTTPKNNLARQAIRMSWGKIIKPLFVMSKTSKEFGIPLENESKVFGDLIVIDENIEISSNEKLFVALKFFEENFNASEYFMLTRDDEFINPRNLYEFLNRVENIEIIRTEFSWFNNYEEENKISLLIMPGNIFKVIKRNLIDFYNIFRIFHEQHLFITIVGKINSRISHYSKFRFSSKISGLLFKKYFPALNFSDFIFFV